MEPMLPLLLAYLLRSWLLLEARASFTSQRRAMDLGHLRVIQVPIGLCLKLLMRL